METLRCPSCAAAIKVQASGGATCPYCGTESHRRARAVLGDKEIPAPAVIPQGPPPDLPRERWRFEQWIGAFLREEDEARRLAIAEAMPAFGEEHLVWAPALADRMIGADGRLDLALGKALGRLAGTWKSVALRGQVLRVVRARLPRLQHAQGVIVALEGVGVAGLKTLLELAEQADAQGHTKRVAAVLDPIWRIVDRQTDPVAAACLEVLFTLLPEAGPANRRFLVHYLADCIDSQYEVPLPGPRDNRNFRFLIPMMARFIDEHLAHHPDLVEELVTEVVRLHTFHSKSLTDARDWSRAVLHTRSEAGREAVAGLVARLYPLDAPFALDAPWEDPAERGEVVGEVVAEVIDGRARCPACGSPVPIRGTASVVACARCARPVRIPAGVRTDLEGRSFEDEIEHWSEAELVAALRREPDAARRRLISAEIDAARTHGSRYVGLVADLVDQMLEDDDERVVINLEDALGRMAASGGEAFRDALLAAVRVRPAVRAQPRLLRCLAPYGEATFGLLLDFGQRSFAEASASIVAAANGSVAFGAASEALRSSGYAGALLDRLQALVLAMPATYDEAGAWQAGEQAACVMAQVFVVDEDDPLSEAAVKRTRRDRMLHFLDTHIDPAGTRYTGMAPHPGCALFIDLGGAPGLGRLSGYVESLWEGPVDEGDFRSRLDWLERAATDAVKLLVLCSIKTRPAVVTNADLERAERVLTPLLDAEPLMPSTAAALAVLRGEAIAEGQQDDGDEAFPTTRPGFWWYLWKTRLRGWWARRRARWS